MSGLKKGNSRPLPLYLAVVLDLFSRKVVGWCMDETMEKGLVMTALTMALKTRRPQKGLLHHSDRGSHGVARRYASLDYQKLLQNQQIICSMIEPPMRSKRQSFDNAAMESFFATLKQELVYHQQYEKAFFSGLCESS